VHLHQSVARFGCGAEVGEAKEDDVGEHEQTSLESVDQVAAEQIVGGATVPSHGVRWGA
jgi:hypothetical protein